MTCVVVSFVVICEGRKRVQSSTMLRPTVVIEEHRAVVSGAPVAAYTGWQHPFVSPLTLSRLGVQCRRAAYDAGWLDANGGFFSLSRDSLKRRVVQLKGPTLEDASAANASNGDSQFSTVFLVAMEATVNDAAVGVPIRNNVTSRAEVFVSAIGNSSFGLGALLYAVGVDAEDNNGNVSDEIFLGSVQLSYVHIDFSTRRPHPLPQSKRDGLTNAFSSEQADRVPKISRLSPTSLLADIAAKKAQSELFFQQTSSLRPSDFDFNLHLNQSMYQVFALDALKSAVLGWVVSRLPKVSHHGGGVDTLEHRVLSFLVGALFSSGHAKDAGELLQEAATSLAEDAATRRSLEQALLQVDSLVTSMRMDFVKEIPMPLGNGGEEEVPATKVITLVAPIDASAGGVRVSFCVCTPVEGGAPPTINACGVITLGLLAAAA